MSQQIHRFPLRAFWFLTGAAALVLGAVGAVLPFLPTTPFVILAAFAFSRSSPALQAWLEGNRIFGPIIADWRADGAIAPRYKAISVGMMAAALALGLVAAMPVAGKLAQVAVMTAAAAFVLSRPNPTSPNPTFPSTTSPSTTSSAPPPVRRRS